MTQFFNFRNISNSSRISLQISILVSACLLNGCGGQQDYGGFSRGLGGDIGNGYNTSLSSRSGERDRNTGGLSGTYPMIETSFHLPGIKTDPFDYEKTDVQVTLRKPGGGTVEVPAFFDGGDVWRMRYTPISPGSYAVITVKINRETAHEEKLEKKEWNVTGEPQPGFVRVDRGDHARFVFESGAHYFPLGHNQAWSDKADGDYSEQFKNMHEAGENWSRVWMAHWDGKNLDWPALSPADQEKKSGKKPESWKAGTFDLEVAKKWDSIVAAAEKNSIYFQLTIQHHGQYSSAEGHKFSGNVNANWEANPYSVANGGFLKNPEDFFTNPEARILTKRKLHYMIARWGYSPNILAWELFNEAEGTDAAHGKMWDDIAMWHREMAIFLRQYDIYHHLITTSSEPAIPMNNPIWETVDYCQTHIYAHDLVTALSALPSLPGKKIDKPIFVGEFGPEGLADFDGIGLHAGVWSSLFSGAAGAAQYWSWNEVDKQGLYGQYKAVSKYLAESALANHGGLAPAAPSVNCTSRGSLAFAPGGGWAKALQSEFVVGTDGAPSGMARFPSFLQGTAHREMMPDPIKFQVNYAENGQFSLYVGTIAAGGAHIKVTMDGKSVEHDFTASKSDTAPAASENVLSMEVPAGIHTITIENSGKDWAMLKEFHFSHYASALAAKALLGKDYAAGWVYHRDNYAIPYTQEKSLISATGQVKIAGLQAGKYRVTWFDTRSGESLNTDDLLVAKKSDPVSVQTPAILRDASFFITKERDGGRIPAARKSAERGNSTKKT